jgi:hypothetical protein
MCTIRSTINKKQTHLFIEPEAIWQVEFDYAVTILKYSMKDYDIIRAKLVISCTHHTNMACVISSTIYHDILTVYVIT